MIANELRARSFDDFTLVMIQNLFSSVSLIVAVIKRLDGMAGSIPIGGSAAKNMDADRPE
jgi:hypothetical protein